jgi:NADPH2:quinone reductase
MAECCISQAVRILAQPSTASNEILRGGYMKAWQIQQLGEPGAVLALADVEDPRPGAGQILVRVLATPANFPDVLMCRGTYQVRPDLPFTPGVELCGEVLEVGRGVTSVSIGDRVIGAAALPYGGFAERALMNVGTTFAAPPELDHAEAASLYIGYQTGWFGLRRRANLREGEVLLVHAAAGGVGSAAVQLGKAMGATVIGVVGGSRKRTVAEKLGADLVVDRHEEDFVAVVKAATDGRGADVVYDPVGGDTYRRSTKCIAFEGRILLVGFAGGEIQEEALNHALVKTYSIVGLHWGLYNERNPGAVLECHEELSALVADGRIRPVVGERIALPEVAAGLQRLADGETVGRTVCAATA